MDIAYLSNKVPHNLHACISEDLGICSIFVFFFFHKYTFTFKYFCKSHFLLCILFIIFLWTSNRGPFQTRAMKNVLQFESEITFSWECRIIFTIALLFKSFVSHYKYEYQFLGIQHNSAFCFTFPMLYLACI